MARRVMPFGGAYAEEKLRQMCVDPSTPPDVLMQIYQHSWARRREMRMLAGNPAMPIEGLVSLARAFPAEVLSNSTFRLHLAVTPDFLDSLRPRTRASIAACPEVDERILRHLASSRGKEVEVRVGAAKNPNCPVDMLHSFIRHAWRVRRTLARHPRLPADLYDRLSEDPRMEVRCALARHPDLPPRLHERLLGDARAEVLAALATRSDLSEKTICALAQPNRPRIVHVELIYNARTPDAVKTAIRKVRMTRSSQQVCRV